LRNLLHPSPTPVFRPNQTLISRDQSTQPNLKLDFPTDTDDMTYNPVWLLKSIPLQAVEVQTEPVAERQRQITAKIQIHPVKSKYGKS